MTKITIKNRKNQKIVLIVEEVENQKGLALVMPGLGGFKEQPHIQTMADAFKENSYTVVRFDPINSIGESDGKYEDATLTNYYEDLEDVIKWAQSHRWYEEPFYLASHSLGGICVALYAENYSEKVKGLAPISTVVSGKLSCEARSEEELKEWERTGWKERRSTSRPELILRLKWSHIVDRLKYDLLEKVDKLTMPVLLIVGENDDHTPPAHQKILYKRLPGKKELHIIKGADHNFRAETYLKELKSIFTNWIKNNII